MSLVKRHPLTTFFVLACALSRGGPRSRTSSASLPSRSLASGLSSLRSSCWLSPKARLALWGYCAGWCAGA